MPEMCRVSAPAVPGSLEHRHRVARRPGVAQHDHAVGGIDRALVGRDIGGMQGVGLDAGLAQKPGTVVRGVPARTDPDQPDPASRQPVGCGCGRCIMSEQTSELAGLRHERVAHL